MLNKFKQTQTQWSGSNDVIDHWLEMRQTLIVNYCQLAIPEHCSAQSSFAELPSFEKLQLFCQLLVDYISEGHFSIYDKVMSKWKDNQFKATRDIDETYRDITLTTEPLLGFADKYSIPYKESKVNEFDNDLALIGEILEARFATEDHLIKLIADSLSK